MAKTNWEKAQAMALSPTARWEWYLKHEYGLTLAEHKQMVEAQEYKCKICLKQKKLEIDHNHKTGQVRGLLCHDCNYRLLGTIERNVAKVERAIKYLKGKLK